MKETKGSLNKTPIKKYRFLHPFKLQFSKKFLTVLLCSAMTFIVAANTAACNLIRPQTPESNGSQVDPTPIDPTPVNPTPIDPTPVDPTPVDPTPVDPTQVDPTPSDPTPVDPTPVDPPKEELTLNEKVAKIIEVIEPNVQKAVGKHTTINNYLMFDYKEENNEKNLYTLVDCTTQNGYEGYNLVRTAVTCNFTEENILNNKFAITSSTNHSTILNMPKTSKISNTSQVLSKLATDNVVNYTGNEDFECGIKGGTVVDTIINCAATKVSTYTISNTSVNYIAVNVKSDGNTKDFITDHLINGNLDKTYRVLEQKSYQFSQNAIYNFNGLINKN